MMAKLKKWQNLQNKNLLSINNALKPFKKFKFSTFNDLTTGYGAFRDVIYKWFDLCTKKDGSLGYPELTRDDFVAARKKLNSINSKYFGDDAEDMGSFDKAKDFIKEFSSFLKNELEAEILNKIKDKKANPPTSRIQKVVDNFQSELAKIK